MTGQPWRVIVIRAWRDGAGVLVRVLEGDDPGRYWTFTSTSAAAAKIQEIIGELEDGVGPPPEPPATDADTRR